MAAYPLTAVVYNPAAAGGRVGRRWQRLEPALREVLGEGVAFYATSSPGEGADRAEAAIQAGAATVLSLGGDGTHNEVVNGLARAGRGAELVRFGVLPAGTGGDFARTFGIPRDPVAAARAAVAAGQGRVLDIGRLDIRSAPGPRTKYFVNVASFGMSGLVDEIVNSSSKALGGRISFLVGTLRAMARYRPATVRLTLDGETLPDFDVNVCAVANARYCGGGMLMAPDADPSDGLFDVIAIQNAPLLRTLTLSPRIYDGSHVDTDVVRTFRAREIVAEKVGDRDAYIDLDGEAPGVIPATFTVVPAALRLLA
ncbi:MAG: diacylglycerol kinase family lipid kinase [Myxococcales bacterium]|nr:diacylglycerol kinase family lipid kinase [Myxococcales bacterium]MCB9531117.1 diacylglycerol kinase family lipid kinase [Myxococcales bacterium]MCB9533027.1 diacylglycerol kinase family lipid kinase [Myxococcales bacterium]